jgi:hypothetical protein
MGLSLRSENSEKRQQRIQQYGCGDTLQDSGRHENAQGMNWPCRPCGCSAVKYGNRFWSS